MKWFLTVVGGFASKIGTQPAGLEVGPRYYAETPVNGPGWVCGSISPYFFQRNELEDPGLALSQSASNFLFRFDKF